jgi:hypothetical protein
MAMQSIYRFSVNISNPKTDLRIVSELMDLLAVVFMDK